jgi:hypothetical protein
MHISLNTCIFVLSGNEDRIVVTINIKVTFHQQMKWFRTGFFFLRSGSKQALITLKSPICAYIMREEKMISTYSLCLPPFDHVLDDQLLGR